jgi:hypothetical protein
VALAAAAMTAAAAPPALAALSEPANALSLPTWAIHVSSVAEWYGRNLCFRMVTSERLVLFLLPRQ